MCERLVDIVTGGRGGKEDKKDRKLAVELRCFEALGMCMRKHVDDPVAIGHCLKALAALSKDASSKAQKSITVEFFHSLWQPMCRLHDPAIATVSALTRNSKENTRDAMRAYVPLPDMRDHLAADSKVRIDDTGRVLDN